MDALIQIIIKMHRTGLSFVFSHILSQSQYNEILMFWIMIEVRLKYEVHRLIILGQSQSNKFL